MTVYTVKLMTVSGKLNIQIIGKKKQLSHQAETSKIFYLHHITGEPRLSLFRSRWMMAMVTALPFRLISVLILEMWLNSRQGR